MRSKLQLTVEELHAQGFRRIQPLLLQCRGARSVAVVILQKMSQPNVMALLPPEVFDSSACAPASSRLRCFRFFCKALDPLCSLRITRAQLCGFILSSGKSPHRRSSISHRSAPAHSHAASQFSLAAATAAARTPSATLPNVRRASQRRPSLSSLPVMFRRTKSPMLVLL